jgi:curved DNA-binding protein CbpA
VSHYDVLGVGPSADETALHQAYVRLARRHHPDVAGGDAGRMQAINEAWATLGDPVRRARYDRALEIGAAPTAPAATASPAADRADSFDDLAWDLADDEPLRITVALPRWLSLLPVAMFAVAVLTFCIGLVVSSEPLLGLALMAFVLSCTLFLASPFLALFASRRTNR